MANRLFLVAIFLLCCTPQQSRAQRSVGVEWEMPDDIQTSKKQLRHFSELGMRYLLIDEKPPGAVWNLISELHFKVCALLPVKFPTAKTFTEADSAFRANINTLVQYYNDKQSVIAIGLFAYGAVTDPGFQRAVLNFLSQTKEGRSIPFFYYTARAEPNPLDLQFAFKILRVTGNKIPKNNAIQAYRYTPNAALKWKLTPVKSFLVQTPESKAIPVFFPSDWLLNILKRHPDLEKTLMLYAHVNHPVFALPDDNNNATSVHNGLIIILLLAWVILAITYYISPVFRKSLKRYIIAHKFYVKDVMQRHIRTALPGRSVLVQHILLAGIVSYFVGNSLFSPLGFQALIAHYPVFSVLGEGNFAFFWWGALSAFLIEIICITWLRVSNPEFVEFSQVFNLYVWPLQLNIGLATLITAIFLSGGNGFTVLILGAAFLVLFVSSFIIASFDSAGSLTYEQKFWFWPATVGVYILLILIPAMWVVFSPHLQNVIELAVSLP